MNDNLKVGGGGGGGREDGWMAGEAQSVTSAHNL